MPEASRRSKGWTSPSPSSADPASIARELLQRPAPLRAQGHSPRRLHLPCKNAVRPRPRGRWAEPQKPKCERTLPQSWFLSFPSHAAHRILARVNREEGNMSARLPARLFGAIALACLAASARPSAAAVTLRSADITTENYSYFAGPIFSNPLPVLDNTHTVTGPNPFPNDAKNSAV